jgi:hypothetical protein
MEIYTIIYVGYEGIDDLIYSTINKEDVILKIKSLKEFASEKKNKYNEFVKENSDKTQEEIDDLIDNLIGINNERFMELTDFTDPDRYCVMVFKESIDDNGYTCCCEQLGVNPSKTILY